MKIIADNEPFDKSISVGISTNTGAIWWITPYSDLAVKIPDPEKWQTFTQDVNRTVE